MLSGMLMLKKLSERFTKKYWKKQFKSHKKDPEKKLRKKKTDYMLNGKAMIILLIGGLIKKISLYRISYFPEPYTHSKKQNKNWIRFV